MQRKLPGRIHLILAIDSQKWENEPLLEKVNNCITNYLYSLLKRLEQNKINIHVYVQRKQHQTLVEALAMAKIYFSKNKALYMSFLKEHFDVRLA